MDGIYSSDTPRILVIAATNRKEMLDSALTRPGRFDRHIQVDLPDKKGRKHILELHAVNKPLLKEVNLEKTAEESYGFSGAQARKCDERSSNIRHERRAVKHRTAAFIPGY